MKKGLPGNRQKQRRRNKKKKEEEEERKLKEEEDKKKKEEDDKKKKEEDEKEKHANEKAKEKPGVKEEDKKEEKTTLAQRVAAKKEILDERIGPKGVQEVDISSSGESMSDEVSSSEDSLDCRESRDQQKGRGQTPKLELGPSKLEMVKEEGTRNETAATNKPEEKASSSNSRGPAAMERSLDEREEPASKSLDKRDLLEIAIDHRNVLEIKGYIYPQSIRSLQKLKDLGYKVHLVSNCGEDRWGDVYCEAKAAWDGWESLSRTETRCGPKGKAEHLVRNGISVLVDDTAEILQEALLKGIKVYPITTKYEKHQWNMFNKPKGAAFCHRYLSDAINHIIMDGKKTKKEWQQKAQ